MTKLFRLVFPITIVCLLSCRESPREKMIRQGATLAKAHCQGCHQFPDPTLLDKKTWVFHVLPKMGSLLGFRQLETTSYFENDYAKKNMTLQQWNSIVQYYVSMSPDSPASVSTPKIDTSLKLFRPQVVPFRVNPPLTSFASIISPQRKLWFADGISKQLYRIAGNVLTDSIETGTGTAQVQEYNGNTYALSMGVMYPSDDKVGKLMAINKTKTILLLDSLQRPVHASFGDLNADTLFDIAICEFGNTTGNLAWFEQVGNGAFRKHVLKALPGAIKTVLRDFNGDGRTDIMAMMAQADEGVFIYYNEGENKFREKRILRFSPAFGSNYFELADMNNDGFEDIVATNGDNGDYPPILKSYHGIRVYLNDGKYNFKEKLFLPVNGVCKAIVRDFDGDGDKDIASIAYFPDFTKRPLESFIYWDNKGSLSFAPVSFSGATSGRWLVMDAADADGDGDDDILLGSARMAMGNVPDTLLKNWSEHSPSVILLENISNF